MGSKSPRKKQQKTVNKSALALHLSVNLKTVEAMIGRGCPVVTRGGRGKPWAFDIAAVEKWRQESITRAPENKKASLVEEETRYKAAKADQAEMEAAKMRGELVEMSAVEKTLTGLFITFQSRVLTLPAKIAPVLAAMKPKDIKKFLETELYDLLHDLGGLDANRVLTTSGGNGKSGAPASDPAPPDDGKRVGRRKPSAKPRSKRRTRKVAN